MRNIMEFLNFISIMIIFIFGVLFILDKNMVSDRATMYMIFLLIYTVWIDITFEIKKLNNNLK